VSHTSLAKRAVAERVAAAGCMDDVAACRSGTSHGHGPRLLGSEAVRIVEPGAVAPKWKWSTCTDSSKSSEASPGHPLGVMTAMAGRLPSRNRATRRHGLEGTAASRRQPFG